MAETDPDATQLIPVSAASAGDTEEIDPQPAFPLAMRGYDRAAVDLYVDRMGHELAEARAGSSPDDAVHAAIERLGQQTADVVRQAHQAAEAIRAEAVRDADGIRAEAIRKVQALDQDADLVWSERARILSDALRLAGELERLVRAANERMPPAADGERETTTQDIPT